MNFGFRERHANLMYYVLIKNNPQLLFDERYSKMRCYSSIPDKKEVVKNGL